MILDNCHIVTAFAAADMNTAKTIAEMAGEARELRPQYSEQRPRPMLGPRRGSVTWREESRPLLLASDVRQLPAGEQLTFVAGTKPLRTRKIKYDREPVFAGRLRPASGTLQRLTTAHDWEHVVSLGRLPASEKPARSAAPRKPAPSSQGDLFPQSGPSLSEQALAGLRPPQGGPDRPDPPVPGKRPRRRTGI